MRRADGLRHVLRVLSAPFGARCECGRIVELASIDAHVATRRHRAMVRRYQLVERIEDLLYRDP